MAAQFSASLDHKLAESKVRSARCVQAVGTRRARHRSVIAGLVVLALLGASVASAAARLEYDAHVGPGPVEFTVTRTHIQLTSCRRPSATARFGPLEQDARLLPAMLVATRRAYQTCGLFILGDAATIGRCCGVVSRAGSRRWWLARAVSQ